MHIEISTDNNIKGGDLTGHVEGVVQSVLGHFSPRISRIEVHVTDANAGKGGKDDKRCMMEARLEGRQPTAVTHSADTVEAAIKGAADKMKRALDTIVGKLRGGH
jgi:hypothetical protein